jgi:hypothetical protein
MSEIVRTRTCDNCGKQKQEVGDFSSGPPPFPGWYTVKGNSYESRNVRALNHFCSEECMLEYMEYMEAVA